MWKTFARTTACLALSAAAFTVIARVNANAAARSKTAAPETEAAEPKPAPPSTRKSAPKPAPAPAPKMTTATTATTTATTAITTASLETKSSFAEPAAARTSRKDDVAMVTLPDWKGKRLSVVRREARKLGLNVSAMDGSGTNVLADEAYMYRVRKQLVEAGSEVEPGSDVPLRVRMTAEAAEGY
jgi:hypothetical protein